MALTQSEINEVMQQLQPIIAKALNEPTSIAQAQANIQQGVTQYIGARYVPLFADPIEWNSTRAYEPLTIVLYQGNSYTTRQYTPAGIEISNEAFWACTGNYNAQIELYRKEVSALADKCNRLDALELKVYETVADMVKDQNLAEGMNVQTLGFHAPDDGGASLYAVKTGESNGFDKIALDNGLIAEFVLVTNMLRPEQFGAVEGETVDSSEQLQAAFDYGTPCYIDKRFGFQKPLYANCSVYMQNTSMLRALAKMDVGVYIAKTPQLENKLGLTTILNVDAHNLAETAIAVSNPGQSEIVLNVWGAKKVGVNTDIDSAGGNRENTYRINVHGNSYGTCEKGVILNAEDCYFEQIITRNCATGVYVDAGHALIGTLHSWLASDVYSTMYDSSCVIEFPESYAFDIHELYQDSVRTGVKGAKGVHGNIDSFYYYNSEDKQAANVQLVCTRPSLTVGFFFNRTKEAAYFAYNVSKPSGGAWGVSTNGFMSDYNTPLPFNDMDNAPTLGGFDGKTIGVAHIPSGVNIASITCETHGGIITQRMLDNSTGNLWLRFKEIERGSGTTVWSPWKRVQFA